MSGSGMDSGGKVIVVMLIVIGIITVAGLVAVTIAETAGC